MARRRVSVPSVEASVPGTAKAFKRVTKTPPTPRTKSTKRQEPTQGVAKRETPGSRVSHAVARRPAENYEEALNLVASREGDDEGLLPYQPTNTSNPPRPRTLAAGYDRASRTLRIRWRDGTGTEYYDIPPDIWRRFQKSASPGRFVNRILNNFEYANTKNHW